MCACASDALLVLGRTRVPVLRQPCVRVRTTVWVYVWVWVVYVCVRLGREKINSRKIEQTFTYKSSSKGWYLHSIAWLYGKVLCIFVSVFQLYFYHCLLFSVEAKTGFEHKIYQS